MREMQSDLFLSGDRRLKPKPSFVYVLSYFRMNWTGAGLSEFRNSERGERKKKKEATFNSVQTRPGHMVQSTSDCANMRRY